MFYVIHLCILYNALPESFLYWKVCYIYLLFRSDSSTKPELYLHLYWYVCVSYNGVCIDIFVYVIEYNCYLYFILVILSYISPIYVLLFHSIVDTFIIVLTCLWIIYIYLLRYVGVLHTICSSVVLHPGKIVMIISCIWFLCPCRHSHWTEFKKLY